MSIAPQSPSPGGTGLEYAVIGNCRIAALLDRNARLVWWCFPRFDSDPVFCRLLTGDEEKGFCDVVLENQVEARSAYLRNTAIVETVLVDDGGNSLRVTDFAPRFTRFERIFNPPQLYRRIEPVSGVPRIRIRIQPTFNYGERFATRVTGSNHIRYSGGADALRVTTDAPLSYILKETAFALIRPVNLVIGPDEPFEASVGSVTQEFVQRTREHWMNWVRSLAVPLEFQVEVIRAAISLKLCSYEETGAIIAAHTTSIPEAPGTMRNWDYRFCWLRDAFFVIKALNRLGATQTMEDYIHYTTNIALDAERPLKPVYGIVPDDDTSERIATELKGFRGNGPVRIGNQAAEQLQHDAYGSVILGAAQMFIDERLPVMGDASLFHMLEPLGMQAVRFAFEPDAGLWEYRGRQCVHTHSATMCWVACDRLWRIACKLHLHERAEFWRNHADRVRARILEEAWSDKRGALAGTLGGSELDASVLLLPELGLMSARDPRFVKTCDVIGRELSRNGFLTRYTSEDDFGAPETAFLVCQMWYMDALCEVGRKDEARALFADLLSRRNSFGLLSEDIHPATGELWGNIPQTYTMAGIVNSARIISRSWQEAWSPQ
ncbi:MAG: glycoside hydrolase family 15 protein [Hyphomicrobiaceae bacterium]|nr:glycoside hydrolase family 15 protein [Hyphomicrobiaceae bacterium]